MPLAFHLTGGEASDSRNFEVLLDLGPDIAPRAAITDKGYDAKANRDGARRRGICPVIPFKSNAIDKPAFFPKILYKARARIEQAVGKLKRFKRIALRCEKTTQNYGSFVALANYTDEAASKLYPNSARIRRSSLPNGAIRILPDG